MTSAGSRAARPGIARPVRLAVATTMAAIGAAGVVLAYVQSNLVDLGYGDYGLYYPGGNLVLRLELDASFRITNGTDLTALTDSMTRWTNVTTSNAQVSEGARFNFASPIDAGAGLANDGINRVYFAETDTTARLGAAIAVSFFWVSGGGVIVDCDIVLNERLYTFSTTTPANPNQSLGSSTYDLGEIATHEMGHCLGLDHSAVAGAFSAVTGLQVSGFSSGDYSLQATLYPYGTRTIQGRSLAQDDVAGASFIYPNSTLNTTTGRITGRVLSGADFTPVRGAHVVAVAAAAPNTPMVGALSDVQAGSVGGEYTLLSLAPGDYHVRLEPLVDTTNPFAQDNTHFLGFQTNFPWEFYNGAAETGFDTGSAASVVTVAAGQTVANIDILTNVGAPDPNEPNNTTGAATAMACEQSVAASIVPRADVDYYRVTIDGATLLQMDVSAGRIGSSLDAVLGLFDATGTRLGFADDSLGVDPILYVELFNPGLYYVAVASKGDEDFNGTGGTTVGSYTLAIRCVVPAVKQGTCPGRVLYAVQGASGILAIADTDSNLVFDGQTNYRAPGVAQPGMVATRRDGAVCLGTPGGTVEAHQDNDGNFTADLVQSLPTGLSDSQPIVGVRRGGAEHLYVGNRFGGGGIVELVDSSGDAMPERTTLFTAEPGFVLSLAMDEGGTLYVLDGALNEFGGLRAYRDRDGDGVAEFSSVFLDLAPQYYGLAGRRPGELFALDTYEGKVDRILDVDRDGVADQVTPYATGFLFNGDGIAFDADDVLYIVDGGNRVIALPDDNGDGVADRQVQFSALNDGMAALAFGQGPPEEVSGPAAVRPVGVTPASSGMLRLTWEDQGPTVPGYNIYEGTLGAPFYSHAPILCHVTGTPDGAGGRALEIIPSGTGAHYYLVTASDACGEGTPGRDSTGRRRPMTGGTCGATP